MKNLKLIVICLTLACTGTALMSNAGNDTPGHGIRSRCPETDDEPIPLKANIKTHLATPIQGAKVKLYKLTGGSYVLLDSVTTNSSGQFVFQAVYFGSYKVAITATGYLPDEEICSVPLIANEVDLGNIILDNE